MEFHELLGFIEMEDKRLKEHYIDSTGKERILSRAVKLAEELGELCNEVLVFNSEQRKEKLDKHQMNLPEEFADVIITTLLLAKTMNVDMEKALVNKIGKINKRYEND